MLRVLTVGLLLATPWMLELRAAVGLQPGSPGTEQFDTILASRADGEDGTKGNDASRTWFSSLSGSGRYIAFESNATNLHPDDDDGREDVFVRDLHAHTTVLASRASGADGQKGNDSSASPSLSANGRYVAFHSGAGNLMPEGPSGTQVYVRDLESHETVLVSRADGADGVPGNGISNGAKISAGGRFVVFASRADNLHPDDPDHDRDVFVRDLFTHETILVSRASGVDGPKGNDGSGLYWSISAKGRHVVFSSPASNLHPDDTDSTSDVFVRDLVSHETILVSRAGGADGAKGDAFSGGASISADGRYATFFSDAANLHPEDTDGTTDIFVRDLLEHEIVLASRADGVGGDKGNQYSYDSQISANGRHVVFVSAATNLHPDDDDAIEDVFVRDLHAHTTVLASRAAGSDGDKSNDFSWTPTISDSGRHVGFFSFATTLHPDDLDSTTDVYVRDTQGPSPLVVAPDPLDFGGIPVGDSTEPEAVTLTNLGPEEIVVSGFEDPGGPFTAVGGTCGAPEFTLAPEASCERLFVFNPSALGPVHESVLVTSDAAGGPHLVSLRGTGVSSLLFTPDSVDFGDVVIDETGAPQSVTVANVSAVAVTAIEVEDPEGPFAATGGSCAAPPFDLAPGADCTLEYHFSPTDLGPAEDVVVVASDSPSGPDGFTLRGRGVPIPPPTITIDPGHVDVTVAQGETSVDGVVIHNEGGFPLTWSIDAAVPPSAGPSPKDDDADGQGGSAGARVKRSSQGGSVFGDSLLGGGPINGLVDCESEPGIVVHDDGTVETGWSGNNSVVDDVIWVDRFTPDTYPAAFRAVCVAFANDVETPPLELEIVVFDDDGPGEAPGTELGTLAATAADIPWSWPTDPVPHWYQYDITSMNLSIESGDVYIGIRYDPPNPNVFIAFDQSPPNPPGFAGGYIWTDDVEAWRPIQQEIPEYRSLFVRAVESEPTGCEDPSELDWLSIAPETDSTPADGSTPVELTLDAGDLVPGEYRATLCVSSNDPARPLAAVPVSLTVLGDSGPGVLDVDPALLDFGTVLVGESGVESFEISNATDPGADDLVLTALDVTTGASSFEIVGGDCEVGAVLPPGAACGVDVEFHPEEAGAFVGAVTVATGDDQTAAVELAGETPPSIEVAPESISMSVPEGGSGATDLSVSNAGAGTLDWQIDTAEPAGDVIATARTADEVPATSSFATTSGGALSRTGSLTGSPLDLGDTQMSQTADTNIVPSNSIACPTGPNHLMRRFYFDEHPGVGNPAEISSVDVAIQEGMASQTLTVNLYTLANSTPIDTIPVGSLTSIGSGTVTISPADDGSIVNVPVSATVGDTAVSDLVVETTVDEVFFIGATNTGETHPGFILSPACGTTTPTPIDMLGSDFEDTHILLVVNAGAAEPVACDNPSTIPWLSVTPESGSTDEGQTDAVSVMIDAGGLSPGDHEALLCVTSNDPERQLTEVPVALTVTEAGAPELTFTPESLDFGDVQVGSTASLTAMLQNAGDEAASDLTVTIDPPDAGFGADMGVCGDSLPAGAGCEVGITFAPTEAGAVAATLTASSAEGASAPIAVAGNGVPAGDGFTPMALEVDPEPFLSDGNGVFEPDELIEVMPTWRNDGDLAASVAGTATDFDGTDGPHYALAMDEADYGLVEPTAEASCRDTGVCYWLAVDDPAVRPATHWMAELDETLSDPDDTTQTWSLHIGDSFPDVPRSSPFYTAIETLLHHDVTGGCTATEYCSAGTNTRGQMAIFLLKAAEEPGYEPPACVAGEVRFDDVPFDSPFCPWIEELASRDVTSGCGDGNYCPGDAVSRGQMAVFLLRAFEGGGYEPPACAGEFGDVDCASPFAAWVEELAERGITGGCAEDRYCPGDAVTRAQMAVFIVNTFGLELYGP